MIAGSLRQAGLSRELSLERVDDGSKVFQIYALVPSLKLANRCFQFREGCAPFPQHETFGVNALTPKRG